MRNAELIHRLMSLPLDAEVEPLYDGFCCIEVAHVYLSQDGRIIMVSNQESIYHDKDRPVGAPNETVEIYYYPGEEKK